VTAVQLLAAQVMSTSTRTTSFAVCKTTIAGAFETYISICKGTDPSQKGLYPYHVSCRPPSIVTGENSEEDV